MSIYQACNTAHYKALLMWMPIIPYDCMHLIFLFRFFKINFTCNANIYILFQIAMALHAFGFLFSRKKLQQNYLIVDPNNSLKSRGLSVLCYEYKTQDELYYVGKAVETYVGFNAYAGCSFCFNSR